MTKRNHRWATALSVLLALLPRSANAATCDDLGQLSLEHTRITAAAVVPQGAFKLPAAGPEPDSSFFTAFDKLRAFCRVEGVIEPSPDSHIEFEVWLPTAGWNGKYLGAGNGGMGGSINYFRIAEGVNAGYAASSTDTGNKGAVL